jgi:AraC-like DNA-binding protein
VFTDGVISLSEKVDVARVSARVAPMSARSYRFHMDFTMAGMLRLIRFFVSSLAPVNAVYFEHRPPLNRREYTRMFGGNESFGHDVTAIEFPRIWLERRALHRSDRLFTMLLGEARRHLDSLENGASYGVRVERYLHSFPPSRVPSMEVAARDLGTSVRSLRRHLAAEGTSYRAFVKGALERAAVEMLRNPQRSVEEIALSAGYAEAPAFNRAFKRWTGLTPSEFRRTTSP